MNRITKPMVDLFNLKMKVEGSCLRYKESSIDGNTITYELMVEDKYIDNKYSYVVPITKEFEAMVRMFFKGYGVEATGFTNTVATIISYE